MGPRRFQIAIICLALGPALLSGACGGDGDGPAPGAYLAMIEQVERERASDPAQSYLRIVEMFSGEEVYRSEPGGWGPLVRWAPDGRHLTAFVVPDEGPARIAVIDFPGGEVHESEAIDLGVISEPAWSPDNDRLAMGFDRLAVFDAEAHRLYQSAPVPPGSGGSSASPPQWSPGGEWVAGSANSTFFLGSREALLVSEDLAGLEVGGTALPAGRWVIGGVRWRNGEAFEVLLLERFTGPGILIYEAEGRVEGGRVVWERLAELADYTDWAPPADPPPEVDLAAVVPDGDYSWDASRWVPPFRTADGSAWVYAVPGGPQDRPWQSWPFAWKLVILDGARAGVVELGEPPVPSLRRVGTLDAVMVRE